MTIQELATVVQEKVAVKIAIINNGYLGMVRQWQELFYERRYVATPLYGPDFVKLAEAYGMPGVEGGIQGRSRPGDPPGHGYPGPFLIDFMVEPEENVYPMVPPGAAISEIMKDPRLDDIALPRKR